MDNAEFYLKGWGTEGQMLVVCGDGHNLCFKNPPMPVIYRNESPLPSVPKLEQGQRAVLVVEPGKAPGWKVKDVKGVSGGQSAGISFLMVASMIWVYHRWQENRKQRDR